MFAVFVYWWKNKILFKPIHYYIVVWWESYMQYNVLYIYSIIQLTPEMGLTFAYGTFEKSRLHCEDNVISIECICGRIIYDRSSAWSILLATNAQNDINLYHTPIYVITLECNTSYWLRHLIYIINFPATTKYML